TARMYTEHRLPRGAGALPRGQGKTPSPQVSPPCWHTGSHHSWQRGEELSPLPAVYVVEERRRDDTGESACLTACWTALCCCCLWDMLT
uniref:Cysteine-rich and transmembrane domain-containing protein 1 n=1 Tax=Bubo bubo TaxID=30461 RepID=A0A8C0IHN8_BUBBB